MVLAAEDVHEIVEEFLAECMLEAGFEYRPRTYVESRDVIAASLELSEAADAGYEGASARLRLEIDPTSLGLPDLPDDSHEASLEYRAALFGSDAVVMGGEPQHSGDEDGKGHSKSKEELAVIPEHGGCTARAETQFADIAVAGDHLDNTTLLQIRQRVLANDIYKEYSKAWRRCMRERSNAIRANDPISETEAQRSDHYRSVAERLNEMAAEPDTASVLFDDIRGHPIDTGWLLEVASFDPELDRIVRTELAIAAEDKACRINNEHLFANEYEQIVQQVLADR